MDCHEYQTLTLIGAIYMLGEGEVTQRGIAVIISHPRPLENLTLHPCDRDTLALPVKACVMQMFERIELMFGNNIFFRGS